MILFETGLISKNQCSILVRVQDHVQVHVHVLQEILLNLVPIDSDPDTDPEYFRASPGAP